MNARAGRLVYYALAALGNETCERQWLLSIRSLRRHNNAIPVVLVLYGSPKSEILATAQAANVQVVYGGDYRNCFSALPPRVAEVLALNPTLHKIPALRLCPTEDFGQILFLDCDTFFFGDVEQLFDRYGAYHLYAREEPSSRRSLSGYDPNYLDEASLMQVSASEGLYPVPPFNSGVVMLNGEIWDALKALSDELMVYAWRLLLGLAAGCSPGAAADPVQTALVLRNATPDDWVNRLTFPSSNAWILEEIALWLTLGRIPGFSHDLFDPLEVAQGGEAVAILRLEEPSQSRLLLAHYYSGGEVDFFAELRRSDAMRSGEWS